MLRADSITFAYSRSRAALSGVSATFAPGRVTAIIGPNGAGKTTLLRVLLGVVMPQRGSVMLDGDTISGMTAGQRAARIAYVPQHPSLGFAYSAREVIGLGLITARRNGAGGGDGVIDDVIGDFELSDLALRAFTELSAGQRQRVTLARAFAQLGVRGTRNARVSHAGGVAQGEAAGVQKGHSQRTSTRVLLADEPFSAMDPRHAVRCAESVCAAAAAGVAVVLVLHDLAAVAGIADDVVVLGESGELAGAGEVRNVLSSPLLERVYGVEFERDTAPGGGTIYSIPWPRQGEPRPAGVMGAAEPPPSA